MNITEFRYRYSSGQGQTLVLYRQEFYDLLKIFMCVYNFLHIGYLQLYYKTKDV